VEISQVRTGSRGEVDELRLVKGPWVWERRRLAEWVGDGSGTER
jgi:hypothetical protein